MQPTLRPGLSAAMTYRVPQNRTVPHLLPESPEFGALPAVFATGYLVGIVEWACMRVVNPHLSEGEQTLGVHVDLTHSAPTLPGGRLTVSAELTQVEGRQLTFAVTVADKMATVCQGTHQRAVINRARFEARIAVLGTSPSPDVIPAAEERLPGAIRPAASSPDRSDGRHGEER